MTDLKILHVVPRWHHGGAAPSVVIEARHARLSRSGLVHRVLALEPGGSAAMMREALRTGLRVQAAPSFDEESRLVLESNVVVLHYWNTPSLRRFLDRWRGTPLRVVVHALVNGLHRPQLLPPRLCDTAAHVVLTSAHLSDRLDPTRTSVIPALTDTSAPWNDSAAGDPGSLVHAGTLNVFKLSPHFVPLHAAVADPSRPVLVAGIGGDEERFQAEAASLGIGESFRWLGFLSDLPSFFAQARLLSYPTSAFTYATGDRVVQDAQIAGVPVLLPRDSPVAHLVREGVTGFFAEDLDDYARKLRDIVGGRLELPTRAAVRAAALEDHDTAPKLRRFEAIYRSTEAGEARVLDDGFAELADWIAFQIGDPNELRDFRRPPLEELRDEAVLARHQRWACEGGFAQYANAFPDLLATPGGAPGA